MINKKLIKCGLILLILGIIGTWAALTYGNGSIKGVFGYMLLLLFGFVGMPALIHGFDMNPFSYKKE